ncbi:tropomyosin alpha-4 chain-like [Erythrolamprus reginae]|uniref:tropomyosin alpha-4 chain-like n=1 Tax=Erythrolamprus reginae TaxID=121349 RepID=UPI00396C7A18
MLNIPTIIKTSKKQISAPSLASQEYPSQSPSQQKMITSILAKEKEEKEKVQPQPTLQTIQDSLSVIQDFMQKTQISIDTNREEARQQHEDLKAEMGDLKVDTGEMKERMKEMDVKNEDIQQTLKENDQRIKTVERKMEKVEQKMEEFEERSSIINRGFDEAITHFELQCASYGLRFQNIVEEKDEDLGSKMAEIIGEILQVDPQELTKEIDEQVSWII